MVPGGRNGALAGLPADDAGDFFRDEAGFAAVRIVAGTGNVFGDLTVAGTEETFCFGRLNPGVGDFRRILVEQGQRVKQFQQVAKFQPFGNCGEQFRVFGELFFQIRAVPGKTPAFRDQGKIAEQDCREVLRIVRFLQLPRYFLCPFAHGQVAFCDFPHVDLFKIGDVDIVDPGRETADYRLPPFFLFEA